MSVSLQHPVSRAGGATLASRIVAEIREAVFDGRLKPGDFLGSESDLGERFDVSRITVRDALRSLSATGIVEIRQGAGGGARIASGNLDYFADALAVQFQLVGVGSEETLEAQSAIESMAAELAADNRTETDLKQMREALERSAACVDDPTAFTEASLGFHLAVAEASHNRALSALLRALRYVVWPTKNPTTTPEIAKRVQRAHKKIYESIEAGDGAAANKAMHQHLGRIKRTKSDRQGEVC